MENISWIFDGIGTSIVMLIIGVIIGGGIGGRIGYKIGIKKSVKQKQVVKSKQVAGDNTTQNQIGNININK